MKPLIRVCINKIEKLSYVVNNRIRGSIQAYYNFYVDNMFKKYNTSLISRDREGALIPGSEASDGTFLYNGCLGSIQSNESDYLLQFVSHPIIGRNLSMGGIYGGSTPIIISAYDPQVKPIPVTILSSLSSPVPFDMKLLFIFSLLVLFFILYSCLTFRSLNRTKKKQQINPFYTSFDIIIGSLLKNHACFEAKIERRKSIRPLVFLVVIFTFLFTYCVCCLIKTEQVVIPEPETIRTYKKIVELMENGKLIPKFMKIRDDYSWFRYSSKNSTKIKLWNQVIKQKDGLETSFIRNREELLDTKSNLLNQTNVFLSSTLFKTAWVTNACYVFKSKNKSQNILVSIDPENPIIEVKSTIKRRIQEFEGDVNRYKRVDDIVNAFHEMGIHEKTQDYRSFTILRGKPMPKGLQDSLRECQSNVIISPHPEFSDKTLKEFESLFLYFISCMFLCSFILAVESMYKIYFQ